MYREWNIRVIILRFNVLFEISFWYFSRVKSTVCFYLYENLLVIFNPFVFIGLSYSGDIKVICLNDRIFLLIFQNFHLTWKYRMLKGEISQLKKIKIEKLCYSRLKITLLVKIFITYFQNFISIDSIYNLWIKFFSFSFYYIKISP